MKATAKASTSYGFESRLSMVQTLQLILARTFGDHSDTLDHILGEISTRSGYDVQLDDIRPVWDSVKGDLS